MSAAQSTLTIEAGGLSVGLSFSYQHPEFSTPLAERSISDARLQEDLGRADVVVVEMAAAAAPLLLQAFEQAQLTVAHSLASLSLAQLGQLQTGNSTPSANERGHICLRLLLIGLAIWGASALISVVLGASHYIDHWADLFVDLFGPDDVATAQRVADDKASAEQAGAQQQRFVSALEQRCGKNAGWIQLGNGAVQCKTKQGHNTVIVWGGQP